MQYIKGLKFSGAIKKEFNLDLSNRLILGRKDVYKNALGKFADKNTPALQMVAGKGCLISIFSPANGSGEKECFIQVYVIQSIIYLIRLSQASK